MPRDPVYVRVEIDGLEESRLAMPEVLLYDSTGRPVLVGVKAQTHEGEILERRAGLIPRIIRERA